MQRRIEEKIAYEYEDFYLSMMCTSKANIFTKSAEIETKKRIADVLKVRLQEEKFQAKHKIILLCDNALDMCYRYILEREHTCGIDENIDKWIWEMK
jgi:hypothetical protein